MRRNRQSLKWALGLLAAMLPALGRAAEPAEATPGEAPSQALQLNLHAYVNIEFEKQVTEEGKGDPNGSFDMDVAELLLLAQRGKLRAAVAVDVEHGADTERGIGTVNLGFGFIEYSFSDALSLRAGKLLNPFGFYNEIHTVKSSFPSVKEASSTLKPYRLSKTAFRYAPKWEAGVAALGALPVGAGSIDYIVTVANGENVVIGSGNPDAYDTNPYDEDNNADKTVTARVRYMPIDGLTVGASFYNAGLTEEVAGVPQNGNLRSFGAFGHYTGGNFFVLAEVQQGRLEPTDGGATATELGWVGSVGYRIRERWLPFVQVERVTAERAGVEDWGMAYVVGLDVTLADGLLFKIDYDYFKGSANNARLGPLPNQSYADVKAALVAAF